MDKRIGWSMIGCLAMAGTAQAAPLDVKTGSWDMTVTTVLSGLKLPPEALAKIPPEKRAQVEQMMADRNGKPTTVTRKACIKQEDLDQNKLLKSDNPNCTAQVTTQTATTLAATRTCSGNPPSTGKLNFTARDRENVKGTIDQEQNGGKVHIDIAGKWVSASCDGVPSNDAATTPPSK